MSKGLTKKARKERKKEEIIERLWTVLDVDIPHWVNLTKQGINLDMVDKMPTEVRLCVSKIKLSRVKDAGDKVEIEFISKQFAFELLSKHYQLTSDKTPQLHVHESYEDFLARAEEGRNA